MNQTHPAPAHREPGFTKLSSAVTEQLFEVQAVDQPLAVIRGFEPEVRADDVVLPIEFVNVLGESMTLGFTLGRDQIRKIAATFDLGEVGEVA